MKKFFIIINSTIYMVLFCFSDAYPLPLTRSCYTVPEDRIDMSLTEKFIYAGNMNRTDNYSFNIGLGSYTTAGSDFSLIHSDSPAAGDGAAGDILINLWHFTGEYSGGKIKSGISIVVRIPTGPDAYTDERYRNLSFGNDELKVSPVFSFTVTERVILLLNMGYTFREERGGDLYGGINLNPAESETWKSLFGLNPFYEDSFMDPENLENDYASLSAGIITSRLNPWVFFSEIYYSSGFSDDYNELNIEGAGVTPLLLSAGVKYFFSDSIYVQFSGIADLLQNEGYINSIIELSLHVVF